MAIPTSTLPRPDEDQDEKFNPGGAGSELYKEEVKPQLTPGELAAQDQLDAAERDGGGVGALGGGLYERSPGGKKSPGKVTGRLRKSSPIIALTTLIFGAGLGFSAFFSPSLLLIHMKEIMVDKFNLSTTSAEARTTRVINAQIDEATTGYCGRTVTLRCKFSTMSKVQVQNFADAGIGVNPAQPNQAFERTKPTSYTFKGQVITPSQFAILAREDPEFRTALRQAYNPKFAGFWGKAWARTAAHFGFSKAKVDVSGEDRAERFRKLQSIAQIGDLESSVPKTPDDYKNADCDDTCAQQKASDANRVLVEVGDQTTNDNPGRKLSGALAGATGEGLTNTVKATGVLDTYCGAYATIRAIGYAGKTIRAVQLARYAMAFYNVTDELVATGNVEPETMAFMAGILTEITYDVGSTTRQIISGSATDSLGFKYAQFGDVTASNRSMNIASRFIAGGGFAGDLIRISETVANGFPGGREKSRRNLRILSKPIRTGWLSSSWIGASGRSWSERCKGCYSGRGECDSEYRPCRTAVSPR